MGCVGVICRCQVGIYTRINAADWFFNASDTGSLTCLLA
jgi:hypothetical protein